MRKFKYFFKEDEKEEAIGYVEANDLEEAIILASQKKRLNVEGFVKVFLVKEMK